MLLTKVFKAVILTFLLVGLNCQEDIVDFKIDASKEYTNEITQSVGPTTSATSRALLDATSAHYLYLDATTGDDADDGSTPALAKKTFDAAYAALAGTVYVIQIMDSSTYELNNAAPYQFGSAETAGIQAALGQAPTLIMTDAAGEIFLATPTGSSIAIISGVSLIGNLGEDLVRFNNQQGTFKIKDNYLYNKNVTGIDFHTNNCIKDFGILSGASYEIENNVLITDGGFFAINSTSSTGTALIQGNIIYQNKDPVDATVEEDYNTYDSYLGGAPTLILDFDAPTLVATIDGTSGISSLSPGVWKDFVLNMAGAGGLYLITGNSATEFFLEDTFGTGSASLANAGSNVYAENPEAAILIRGDTANTLACTVKKNIIVAKNHKGGIVLSGITGVTANTMTAEGNVVLNCLIGIMAMAGDPQVTTSVAAVTASENIFYTSVASAKVDSGQNIITTNPSVTITSDPYSNAIVPLYFNQQNALIPVTTAPYVDATLGYVKSAYDFRLRAKGKKYTPSSSIMILDSPLLEKYVAPAPDEDLNPWEETLVAGALTYASTVTIDRPPKSLNGNHNPRNPVEIMDLLGNPQVDWDAIKKEFGYTWPGASFAGNENVWKLAQIKEDKKPKRWYPRKVGESIFINSTNGAFAKTTTTVGVFTPGSLAVPMIPTHWKGFWITFDSKNFYIKNNISTALTIIDKDGVGFPADASYDFTIEFMLVQLRPGALAFNQANYNDFLEGGKWSELASHEKHEYTGPSIVLMEAENPL